MLEQVVSKGWENCPTVEDINRAIANAGLVGEFQNGSGEWEKDWCNLSGYNQYVFEITLTRPAYTRITHDDIPEGAELVRVIYDMFTNSDGDPLGAEVRFPERVIKFKGRIRPTWINENKRFSRDMRDIRHINVWVLELEEVEA